MKAGALEQSLNGVVIVEECPNVVMSPAFGASRDDDTPSGSCHKARSKDSRCDTSDVFTLLRYQDLRI